MIRGHVALVRHLRAFMETSGLPWLQAHFKYEQDDDGRPIYERDRAEMSFAHNGKSVDVVIYAPSEDANHGEKLPLGKLAVRVDGVVMVKGPIDPVTWDRIVAAINADQVQIAC